MNQSETARYIMIGGFLGSGKSTSILKLAEHLKQQGKTVGLITNDQGQRLVDTMNVRSKGFAVEEIAGGCFCCRFNSLMDAARNLTQSTRPDVFIAEPVGSCTDLIASVSYPLRRIYGHQFTISPLSVLLDPKRALRIFELGEGRRFSPKVTYIYLKQIEEASTIVINKIDTVRDDQLHLLERTLMQRFPGKEIIRVSARHGANLTPWFNQLMDREQAGGASMDVDYQTYAEGEALLGWLNATIELDADPLIDGDSLLEGIARSVQTQLNAQDAEIAHFKMTLSPMDRSGELGVINLVGTDFEPEFTQTLLDPVDRGQIIVNLRAEAEPQQLEEVLKFAIALVQKDGLQLKLDHFERFKPSEPVPLYRMPDESELRPYQRVTP